MHGGGATGIGPPVFHLRTQACTPSVSERNVSLRVRLAESVPSLRRTRGTEGVPHGDRIRSSQRMEERKGIERSRWTTRR